MRNLPNMAALSAVLLLAGCGDPEGEANALYVEAAGEISSAQTAAPGLARYEALSTADAKIRKVLSDYPKTAAAVRIAANEKIGTLTRPGLAEAIQTEAAHPSVCQKYPTVTCIGELTFEKFRARGLDTGRALPLGLFLAAQRLGNEEAESALLGPYNAAGKQAKIWLAGTEPYFADLLVNEPENFWAKVTALKTAFPRLVESETISAGMDQLRGAGRLDPALVRSLLKLAAASPPWVNGAPAALTQAAELIPTLKIPDAQKLSMQNDFIREAIRQGQADAIPSDFWSDLDQETASYLIDNAPEVAGKELYQVRKLDITLMDIRRLAEKFSGPDAERLWRWYIRSGSVSLPVDEILAEARKVGQLESLALSSASIMRMKSDQQGALVLARAAVQASAREKGPDAAKHQTVSQVALLVSSQGATPNSLRQIEQYVSAGKLAPFYSDIIENIAQNFPEQATPDWLLGLYSAWIPHVEHGPAMDRMTMEISRLATRDHRPLTFSRDQLTSFAMATCGKWTTDPHPFYAGPLIELLFMQGLEKEAETFIRCHGQGSQTLSQQKLRPIAQRIIADVLASRTDSVLSAVAALPPEQRSEVLQQLSKIGPASENEPLWRKLRATDPDAISYVLQTASLSLLEEEYQRTVQNTSAPDVEKYRVTKALFERYRYNESKAGLEHLFFSAPSKDIQFSAGMVLMDLYTRGTTAPQ